MEQEKTEELLRRYYEGLTSVEEEELLRQLLDTPEYAVRFASDRILLSAGRTEVPEPSAGFMKSLGAVTLKNEPPRVLHTPYRYALSVAAGIAMLLGSYFIFRTLPSREPDDTFSDPELAMAEVRNILLSVSRNMNTGTGALRPINTLSTVPGVIDEMGSTVRGVDKSLSRLRYLNALNPENAEDDNNN